MVTNFSIFYFNLKPSIDMNLLPILNDGHLPTAQFDILLDMFLMIFRFKSKKLKCMNFNFLNFNCHFCDTCHISLRRQ